MYIIATVEVEMCSTSVSVVYVVYLRIVFSKAALQNRGSMEPTKPRLDPPLVYQVYSLSTFCWYIPEHQVHIYLEPLSK